MKIKKSLIVLIIIMFAVMSTVSAFAVDYGIDMQDQSANIGSSITVPVTITSIPDNWTAVRLHITYDPAVMTMTSMLDGDIFSNATMSEHVSGTIIYTTAVAVPVESGSTICTLNFDIRSDIEKQTTVINIEDDSLLEGNLYVDQIINTTFGQATITVTATPAYALAQVNTATDTAGMQTALETYQAELGLTMTDYNALGASYKTAVASEVLEGKPYASVEAAATAFDNAVAKQKALEPAVADAQDSVTLVEAIPDSDLSTQQLIDAAQTKVNNAQSDMQTVLGIESNYDTTAWQTAIATAQATINEAQQLLDAITDAVSAISEIPDASDAGFDAAVENARTEADEALALGATIASITNYADLQAAETLAAAIDNAETEVAAAQDLAAGDLGTQALINAAQAQHGAAQDAIDDVDAIDSSYDTTTWDNTLSGVQSAINEAQTRLDSVNAAITAIDAIPAVGDGHEAATQNARTKADAALALGASTSDITNYDDLLAAEAVYYHGYLVGTFQKPNSAMTTTTLKVYLDGQMIGQKTVDFTNGNVSFEYGEFQISEFSPDLSNTVLTVTMPGYVYQVDMGARISIEDLDRGEGAGSDTLDIAALTILPVAGDANNDGEIGLADLALMAQTFNTTVSATDFTVNYNGDTTVDVKDLYFIGLNFGYGIND